MLDKPGQGGPGGENSSAAQPRELPKITTRSDTRDVLAHAGENARFLQDTIVVDVDAHVTELAFWSEVTDLIDSDVYRQMAASFRENGETVAGLMNVQPGLFYQPMFGRIPHDMRNLETVPPEGAHRQTVLTRRAMDAMGIDYMVVFPTPMLQLAMHPQPEIETILGTAFNRWLVEKILPQEPRMKGLLYLPFNDVDDCLDLIERFGASPHVIGFTVTSTRYKPVHHNQYMRLYAAIQESGKPLAFHAGYNWGDASMLQINRFIGMHALSFVQFNLVHLTNWVLNGLPERFPRLKVIWVESGVAWVPFIMQRLDAEYLMRSSEAPLLKRLPSEYIAEMYFTSQPLETTNLKLTAATFEAINAETQLLFSSDWPHWDFNTPSAITNLGFLSDAAKRNILGLNAAKLFNLDISAGKLATPEAHGTVPSGVGG